MSCRVMSCHVIPYYMASLSLTSQKAIDCACENTHAAELPFAVVVDYGTGALVRDKWRQLVAATGRTVDLVDPCLEVTIGNNRVS